MLLNDTEILQLIKTGVLENAAESLVGPVSCDLRADSFYTENGKEQSSALGPGDSVFVSPAESIHLPADLVARVLIKNSRLRQGLTLDAPLYFPGHETRPFFRVTNVSGNVISLEQGDRIAQVTFERLSTPAAAPYSGAFSDEFDFKGLASYSDIYESQISEIEKKEDALKNLERTIYGNILTLFAVFAAIFTIANVSLNGLGAQIGSLGFIAIILAIVGSFAILVGLMGLAIERDGKGAQKPALIVGATLLVAAVVVALLV